MTRDKLFHQGLTTSSFVKEGNLFKNSGTIVLTVDSKISNYESSILIVFVHAKSNFKNLNLRRGGEGHSVTFVYLFVCTFKLTLVRSFYLHLLTNFK